MRAKKAAKKKPSKRAETKMGWARHRRRVSKGPARTDDRDDGVIDLFVSTYRSLG
jgi:hypothetical protein